MKLTTDIELYAYQEGYKEAARYFEKELREIKKWGDEGKYYEPEDVIDGLEGVIDVATDYARKGPDSMQTELDFEEDSDEFRKQGNIEKYIEDIDTRIEHRKNSIDQWFDALAFLLRDYKDGKKNKLQTLIETKNIIEAIEASGRENDELLAIQAMLTRMDKEVKENN